MLTYFLLTVFSFLAIISAFLVVVSKNTVHSVFFLILVFFSATALLILLEVDYLAMILLIVYVGAIAVLFLFVVMLLNLKLVELQENFFRYLPISIFLSMIFCFELFLLFQKEFKSLDFWTGVGVNDYIVWVNTFFDYKTSLDKLSVLIYNYFFFDFILCGLLLLVAMVGAIVLTVFQSSYAKKQDIIVQLQRDIRKTIKVF